MWTIRQFSFLVLVVLFSPLAKGWNLFSDDISVALTVVDEQGKAIPYPTVWGYVLPRSKPESINGEDLWRLTMRYRSSFEFATAYNRIIPSLLVMPMGNSDGKASFKVDYEFLEGRGNKRPAALQVGFTVMKNGYLPARAYFSVGRESRLSADVVLKRDPEHKPEMQPYIQEYERVRYELSDPNRNETLRSTAHKDTAELRQSLLSAAKQAMNAGDDSAAARIYTRLIYAPSTMIYNGQVTGWAQQEPRSDESLSYLKEAYRLAPDNIYIAATYVNTMAYEEFKVPGSGPLSKRSDEVRVAFSIFLTELDDLLLKNKKQVWPGFLWEQANWHDYHGAAGERQVALDLLEQLYEDEPKYMGREEMFRFYR
ncbi:hypothetical protein [Halopseudomonas sabulinigri]|uniref:Uncharacterized protein n=1 Tax=Halopseudomonas sabulinigri TaxID=472181 RepID=A0A1H1LGI3_9GAMM|nr:hypothetical protein [Halopseudomonas sabulinigri]SDR73422.1 hypothetical protein SAMN05216271_0213 [Halopseudomonas sabulinigri]